MNVQAVSFTPFNTELLEARQDFTQNNEKKIRRKHRVSLRTKYEILQRLKSGETLRSLSKEYNMPESTVGRIRKQEDELLKFHLETEHITNMSSRKCLIGKRIDTSLEDCVIIWYLQNYQLGNIVSGKMLKEKALEFNVQLNGSKTFKASNGWLQRFKKRCGIKLQPVQEEKSSINSGTSFEFKTKFSQAIKTDKYPLENVYNAEENILWWKTFPKRTEYEKNAPKVTLIVCANATGSHKIPLMMIGRSKIPWSLKSTNNLPIKYAGQESSWIDDVVFMNWLKTIFVPSVKKRQQQDGKQGSIVLLLDSSASRYVSNTNIILSKILIKIVLLPMNLTSNVLPMNQGIIEKLKIIYRQNFLQEIIQRGIKEDTESLNEFLKTWNLRDSCHILKDAWDIVSPLDIIKSWKAVCTEDMLTPRKDTEKKVDGKSALLNLLKKIPGYEDSREDDTLKWLDEDSDEYNDIEINFASEVAVETNSSPKIVSDEYFKSNVGSEKVSTEDAIVSLNNVLRWVQEQDDVNKDLSYFIQLREEMKKKLKQNGI